MTKRDSKCGQQEASIRHHDGTKIEYQERRDRLRQVLESRKAKSANDQEIVQSAAASKANINDINNDAKKAK